MDDVEKPICEFFGEMSHNLRLDVLQFLGLEAHERQGPAKGAKAASPSDVAQSDLIA